MLSSLRVKSLLVMKSTTVFHSAGIICVTYVYDNASFNLLDGQIVTTDTDVGRYHQNCVHIRVIVCFTV